MHLLGNEVYKLAEPKRQAYIPPSQAVIIQISSFALDFLCKADKVLIMFNSIK